MKTIYEESKNEIRTKIKNAMKINLGADIWTKKGLTESYLGVKCYFYDEKEEIIF